VKRPLSALVGLVCTLALAGCAQSVRVLIPPTGNPPPFLRVNPQDPLTFAVEFHSRADVSTFRATLNPNPGYPTTGGTDITASFSQPFTPGGQSTAVVTVPPTGRIILQTAGGQEHRLRVEARMRPSRAFDSMGHEHLFRLPGPSPMPPPPGGPALGFSLGGPITINAGASATVAVTASPAPSSATTVNLTSSAGVTVPATTTIPANTTMSGQFAIAGQIGGSATVTAAAAGFQSGSLTVRVRPVIANLNPTSGAPGTVVTVDGTGFAPGASVSFDNQAVAATFISSTRLTASVPNVAPGARNVTVAVGGQTSQAVNFQALAGPPQPILLFRTSGGDVQTISFVPGTGFTLLDTDPATPQGGTAVVGVSFNGQMHVLRTSAGDVQSFELVNNNSLNLVGTEPGNPSGTGAAIAAAGNLVMRASDVGLETYSLVAGAPQRQVQQPVAGTVSFTGVAVDLSGNFAVRAHATGIDVYNVSNVSAPVLVGFAQAMGGQISSVGVGVKFAPGGSIAVRSGPVGIDVYTIAANGTPALAGSFTTGVVDTTLHTAVAIDATGTRAIRAHSTGIEVYDISTPATPQRIGQRAGTASTTGVGVFISGNTAFRAMNAAVEAYDISNPASIPAPGSIPAAPSFVGVGLSGR
jgi:IPT/TIG domain